MSGKLRKTHTDENDTRGMPGVNITPETWQQLGELAWQIREHAYLHGETAVGAAVLGEGGTVAGAMCLRKSTSAISPWSLF